MAQLSKNGIKTLKALHYVAVSCWVGTAFVLLLFNVCNKVSVSEGMLLGLNTASHKADIWILIPGAIGCLLTGLLFALFTPWGFFKHKWLVWKWILTIACILTGTFLLGVWEREMLSFSQSLGNMALTDVGYLAVKAKHFWLSCVQIATLLFMVIISVFRSWRSKNK